MDVLATPIMIGLMEDAARRLVDPLLDPGQMTVGVNLNVTHLAPPLSACRLPPGPNSMAVDGRWLTFKVEAHDDKGKIGEGTHTRAIINVDRFMAKTREKTAPPGS